MRVVVVAEESAGAQVLEALHVAPERPEIAAVITSTERSGKRLPLVAAASARLGLDVRPASQLRNGSLGDSIRDLDVDLLLNVHSVVVLDAQAVSAPRVGSFNLHPGPLPEYAGLNAPSWAIYEGRTTHAVTLHWMDEGIDSGPVAYRTSFAIEDADTGLSLTAKCVRHGVPLVSRLIADVARDPSSVPALEQDLRKRRYFGGAVPNEGNIVWTAAAREIVRFVRAADYSPFDSPWGVPRARVGGSPVGIAKASLTGEEVDERPGTVGRKLDRGGLLVAAADEWVAVHRMWRAGRYVSPSQICVPGDRIGDGT